MRRRMSGEGRRASPGAKQRPGRAKPRRSAAGAAAGRSALGADGRRDGQINGTVIPLKIPPPELPREFTPEFGGGGGEGGSLAGGGEQARSILKKTPAQNFPKKYFGNSARRGKRPGGKGNERHMRTHRPDNWIIPLGGEWRRTGALNSRHAPRRSGRIPGTARAKN